VVDRYEEGKQVVVAGR